MFKIAPWTRLYSDKCCPLPSRQQSEDTVFSRLSPLIYSQLMVTTVYCEPNQAAQSCHMSHGKEAMDLSCVWGKGRCLPAWVGPWWRARESVCVDYRNPPAVMRAWAVRGAYVMTPLPAAQFRPCGMTCKPADTKTYTLTCTLHPHAHITDKLLPSPLLDESHSLILLHTHSSTRKFTYTFNICLKWDHKNSYSQNYSMNKKGCKQSDNTI